ncbi:MAG: hypothetical protein QOF44_730 [Streptomyces sp.]|nr:hypothetical protein [Streptomyces sp.]
MVGAVSEHERADPLLSIGVFARRSRLSLKALRLYDRLGVLAPADVDPASGYRRYRESQLATARLVATLRGLDMPLAEVARVVAAPGPQGAGLIAAYWEAVERRVAAQRELAAHVGVTLSGGKGSYGMYEIKEREVPEQLVLAEQRHVGPQELPEWIGAAIGRLVKAAQEYGGVAGPPFVVYHGEVSEDGDGPAEACVPVRPGQDVTAAAARVEPAHREVYTRLVKDQVQYPRITIAFDAVAHRIAEQGLNATASCREVYFTDWDSAGPDDEVCDVAYPVEG